MPDDSTLTRLAGEARVPRPRPASGRRRGHHRQPGSRARDCPQGGTPARRSAPSPTPAPPTSSTRTASSCYGNGPRGPPIRSRPTRARSATQVDHPILPAVGHPAFGDLGPAGSSFVIPAAGFFRALDLALPEYQPTGQDFSPPGTRRRASSSPSFPADGERPSVPHRALDRRPRRPAGRGDRLGLGEQGSGRLNAAGLPVDPALAEADHRLDGREPAHRHVRDPRYRCGATQGRDHATRSGYINAFATAAPACSPVVVAALPPRQRQLGRLQPRRGAARQAVRRCGQRRDADFKAPGDDLLCGTADRLRDRDLDRPDQRDELRRGDAARPARRRPPRPGATADLSRCPPRRSATSPSARSTSRATSAARRSSTSVPRRRPGGGGGAGGDRRRWRRRGAERRLRYARGLLNAITGTAEDRQLKGTDGDDRIRGARRQRPDQGRRRRRLPGRASVARTGSRRLRAGTRSRAVGARTGWRAAPVTT